MTASLARIACLGGIYSNYLALEAALADIRRRGVDAVYCLGDCGAFGPHPDRTLDVLRGSGANVVQGNYDHSIGHGLDDCRCGYTDPRDNHFAQLSYDYTLQNTSDDHRAWLRQLPTELRWELGGRRVLACHGSPRRTNEFLWESTTSTQFLDYLGDEFQADVILATHPGIKWERQLAAGRRFVNVGVLGRPENDGTQRVWYTIIEASPGKSGGDAGGQVEFVPVEYDFRRLAREMAEERLPAEFLATILTGFWTTCLEILPAKERRKGRF